MPPNNQPSYNINESPSVRSRLSDDDARSASKSIAHSFTVKSACSSTQYSYSDDTTAYTLAASIRTGKIKTSELRKPKAIEPMAFRYQKNGSSSKPALNFDSMALIGREGEVAKLKASFERLVSEPENEGSKELFIIGGESGTGKSTIALSLEGEVSKHNTGMFVQGKFDMNASSEPYSGISKAFGDLCRKIMESKAETVCAVQAGIKKALGSEVDLLVHLIPELKDLVGDTFTDSEVTNIGADEVESKLERLRFAFRVLMRVFCSVFSPLVLFLDDLQWADISSLQVLDFLISDAQNQNALMIIGCYRLIEVDENSLLHNKMIALREKREMYKFNLTEIKIGPFGTDEIEQVIAAALPSSDNEAKCNLAALCLKRTHGNQFFVLEFLKMLYYEGLILQDDTTKSWSWDLNKIEDATMSTANVVVMLHDRLTKLSPQIQALLQCASYLGSTFDEATIDLVWTTYGRRLVESRIDNTKSLLEAIVKEEILENGDTGQYRWVHDVLREAALSLTGERRESFQLDIGRTLYYGLEKKQVEENLFPIVDLINNGNVLKLTEFAPVNLRAAEKARDLSAFQSAAEYAAHGLSLLKEDKWSSNRPLTLKLYTMGAEMEIMVGNVEAANRYSSEVLRQKDLSIMEALPLKMAQASTVAHTGLQFDKSLECYMQVLKDLGCRVTWTKKLVPVQSLVKLMKTIKKVNSKPLSFYDEMVVIEDPKQKAIATAFSKVLYVSFVLGDMLLYLLCACRLVDMTLEHGVNEFSAKSFASLASGIIIGMQDVETATKFNMIAISMMKKFRGIHNSETTFICYGPGLSWVKPFEELIPPMRDAVSEGMRAGDTEFACWNLLAHQLFLAYNIGKPIAAMLEDAPSAMVQCEDTAQLLHAGALQVMWQMMKNLNDCSSSKLEGDIYTAEKGSETNPAHLSFVHFAEGELLLFNADYEAAAKRALEVGESYDKLLPNSVLNTVESFHRAVPVYAAARITKTRKYRREARRLLKKIAKWAQAGNPNVQYYCMFLTAEQLALDGKYEMAEQKYEEAIAAATAAGHLHHIALINERYADFLSERSMTAKVGERLQIAIQYYKEWGAGVKVEQLESRLRTSFLFSNDE
ncbi:unnamed protein product [Cylindrotheca closterium]|uniref:Orc1-like AAA ATPase domain-containing protein n=1 Tax=Cylindrotheca closterium TaxID=2856 RepID=A0AAD2CCT9_9STRA|nr:unnamed protein product [Cylindrotheca closterium]